LKVTIDSNDPLPEALRVLGAMYDVTLVVEATTSKPPDTAPPANGKRSRATAKTAARNGRATKGKRGTPTRSARRSAGNGTAPGGPELRSWARAQGYQVGDRGRMPAAVIAAYREASPS
jgi:hypothetical protein